MSSNESKYIRPEVDCKGCGKCCESFEIWYGKANPEVTLSEMQRFQMLAEIGDRITLLEESHGTWLVFHFPCRFLNKDKTCAIYDSPTRPLLCRQFPYKDSTITSCPKVRN